MIKLKKLITVLGSTAGVMAAGVAVYTVLNKKMRRKAEDYIDTMVNETKQMMKK